MKMPVYFVSHGGGPWPWISEWDAMYAKLHESLVQMPAQLPQRPKAILMVSAHWISRDELQVMTNPQPGMFYDYYGFPEHTYKVEYSAPGSPALAQEDDRQGGGDEGQRAQHDLGHRRLPDAADHVQHRPDPAG